MFRLLFRPSGEREREGGGGGGEERIKIGYGC